MQCANTMRQYNTLDMAKILGYEELFTANSGNFLSTVDLFNAIFQHHGSYTEAFVIESQGVKVSLIENFINIEH